MDAIAPTSEDEKMAVADGQEPMTENYFRVGVKRKLDEEGNSEEDPFQQLGFLLEVLQKMEEEELKELRKTEEKIKRREKLEKAAALVKQGVRSIKTSDHGVYVQAPTLDSLEAFLKHLKSIGIPYFAVKIGPVVKEDVMKASTMLENDIHYATILAFDVKVERDAQMHADAVGVRIISVDSIQQAGEQFFKYREECLKKKKKQEAFSQVIFPCICVALTSGKTSFGVFVEQGRLRVGTPLLARDRGNIELGVVASISAADGSSVDIARAGDQVKIQMKAAEKPVPVWVKNCLISRVTRKSYDFCKRYCWKEFSVDERDLMLHLWMASNLRE